MFGLYTIDVSDMKNCNKRPRGESATVLPAISAAAPPRDGFPLPDTIVLGEIFRRLELDSLCTLACVCQTLRSMVSQALSTLPSLDLSAFSPNGQLVRRIVPKLSVVKSVTIDCLHLDDCSVVTILGPHIRELNLLKCASLSYQVLASIGKKCPNLRILVLELAGESSPEILRKNLNKMLANLLYLENLSIKVRGTERYAHDLSCLDLPLPETLKFLKLHPVNEQDATQFLEKFTPEIEIPRRPTISNITRLSLVLNVISDTLLTSIATSLPRLVELGLKDRPCTEPKLPHDLTNNGLQFLGSCRRLTHLSIVRSRLNYPVSFKKVNDMGLLLLAETSWALQFIRLVGFSKVTDAGFSHLVQNCRDLEKLEIRNAPLLSDLAFHDTFRAVSRLVELRLRSCNLITSEAMSELASSATLETLDTFSCKSVSDRCLDYVSRVRTLTSLNLGGADITDSGLRYLSKGDLALTSLCLRGCARVTDRGIICLLSDGARMKKTLSSLDIGHMPGISDRGIGAIISGGEAITELSMRYCFHVTDVSFRVLGSGEGAGLRKLDICHCVGFSAGVVELIGRPFFRGLRWLGVGGTCLVKKGGFAVVCEMRPWLTVCFEDCEIGCEDGWQFHKYNDSN
ncbi:F-box protein at-b [Phtheirospermum japonicum]|uniref:F-box protein at-b n=1 Tax=Phtheirospermum japonicum TaxID=374723 RepID=A0A830CZ65_9LAMI|nr:F-box protein at-b [Phtheirospermum japonicum]